MAPTNARRENRALPDKMYQEELGELVKILEDGGRLFIFRNHVPRALFKAWAIFVRGTQAYHSDYPISNDAKGLRSRGQSIWKYRDRVTMVIPRRELEQPATPPPVVSSRERVTPPVDSGITYEDIATDFYNRYRPSGALLAFDPEKPGRDHELVRAERQRLGLLDSKLPITNFLPNIWVAFTKEAIESLAGTATYERKKFEDQFIDWVALIGHGRQLREQNVKEEDLPPPVRRALNDLDKWLESGGLRIIQVSEAQVANAQYFGQRILDTRMAERLLIHGGLTCLLSGRLEAVPQDGSEVPSRVGPEAVAQERPEALPEQAEAVAQERPEALPEQAEAVAQERPEAPPEQPEAVPQERSTTRADVDAPDWYPWSEEA